MGDAARFETARRDGQHLGPGSYDLPSTLTNGEGEETSGTSVPLLFVQTRVSTSIVRFTCYVGDRSKLVHRSPTLSTKRAIPRSTLRTK